MSNDKHKFLTIITLLALLFVIIFAFSNLSNGTSLNADDGGKNNNTPPPASLPFSYINSRTTQNPNVLFENNFGGSGIDTVEKVYAFDYYYAIGTTTSNDKYFNKNLNQSAVFVAKLNNLGNAENFTVTTGTNTSFVSSIVSGFGIYLLTNNFYQNSTSIYFYSFENQNISLIATLDNTQPLLITKSDDLVVLGNENQKLTAFFINETTNIITKQQIIKFAQNAKLIAPYKSGIICFVNTTDSFNVYYFNKSSYELLHYENNYSLLTYSFNQYGYALLLSNSTNHKFILLSYNLQVLNQHNINILGSQLNILEVNNNFYLLYKNTHNQLVVTLFSNKLDQVLSTTAINQVNSILFNKTHNNNLLVCILTQEMNLKVVEFTQLLQIHSDHLISFNSFGSVKEIETTQDNHLMFFGNISGTTTIISNNFGNSDFYVFKMLNY